MDAEDEEYILEAEDKDLILEAECNDDEDLGRDTVSI